MFDPNVGAEVCPSMSEAEFTATCSRPKRAHNGSKLMPKFVALGIVIIAALVSHDALADDSERSETQQSPARNEPVKRTWAELSEIEAARIKANKGKFNKPCSYYYLQVEQSRKRLRALTAAFERKKSESAMQRMHEERGRLESALETAEECTESSQPSSEQIAEAAKSPVSRAFMWSARICAVRRQWSYLSRNNAALRRRGYIGLDEQEKEEMQLFHALKDAEHAVRAAGLKLSDCSDRQVRELSHCLQSLEESGTPIGSPYGGGHCDLMPYSAAKIADSHEPPMKLTVGDK